MSIIFFRKKRLSFSHPNKAMIRFDLLPTSLHSHEINKTENYSWKGVTLELTSPSFCGSGGVSGCAARSRCDNKERGNRCNLSRHKPNYWRNLGGKGGSTTGTFPGTIMTVEVPWARILPLSSVTCASA